jgi:hypothetical protein
MAFIPFYGGTGWRYSGTESNSVLPDVVEWGLDVQQAAEGPNLPVIRWQSSFGDHAQYPGRIQLDNRIAKEEAEKLEAIGI